MTPQQVNAGLETVLTGVGISAKILTDDTDLNRDLGLDSLDIISVLLDVEHYFSIRIPDEDWWKLQTVGQLREYLFAELRFDTGQSLLTGAA